LNLIFFSERQKATRQLKKLRKRILEAASTNEVEALKTQLHVAEVDLNYTQYCPLNEPYVSLYPLKDSAKSGSTHPGGQVEASADQARQNSKNKATASHKHDRTQSPREKKGRT
jgi:hypothetical protein